MRVVPVKEIHDDLRLAVDTIISKHPYLAHSVEQKALEREAAKIERQLTRPMTRDQAWAALAQLNPLLADGHLMIGMGDWRSETATALKGGSGFFPFEISLESDGTPRIIAALGGASTSFANARIDRINGRSARLVARELLARAHGDTPLFRAALVSGRWWLFYKKLYGSPSKFEIKIEGAPKRLHVFDPAHAVPEILQREASFERNFTCEITPRGAVLGIASFSWPDEKQFLAFTEACFTRIRAAAVRRLVIDIRLNGGGNDSFWINGIQRYIADRPYKTGSHYIKRVQETDPAKGEVAGEVVTGMIERDNRPADHEPLRFTGQVYVLAGPSSYSSAILFANVVQDYGFAVLTGTPGAARTKQSGGVKTMTLPNTGLSLAYPRFILSRPSGEEQPALVQPTIVLDDNPINARASIDGLLDRPIR